MGHSQAQLQEGRLQDLKLKRGLRRCSRYCTERFCSPSSLGRAAHGARLGQGHHGFHPRALGTRSHNDSSMALLSPGVLVLPLSGSVCRVRPAPELGQLPAEKNNTKFSDTTICVASKPTSPQLMEQKPFPSSPPHWKAEHCPPGLEQSWEPSQHGPADR